MKISIFRVVQANWLIEKLPRTIQYLSDNYCTNVLPHITAFSTKASALNHQTLHESNITQSQSNCSIREHHSRGTRAEKQTRHEPTDNTFIRTFFGVNVSKLHKMLRFPCIE